MKSGLKIDIGCGNNKRKGFIGIDYVASSCVDYVLDLSHEPLPFEDRSVCHVYSSHFLEHIPAPNHIFQEIGRVCCDGAKIEIYTPYAFSNEAFLYGHVAYLTEEIWIHFCYSNRDVHIGILKGRWILKNINYVISEETHNEIEKAGFSIEFAIKYFKSVILEFKVDIEYWIDLATPATLGTRTYSYSRTGKRFALGNIADARLHTAMSNNLLDKFYRFKRKLSTIV